MKMEQTRQAGIISSTTTKIKSQLSVLLSLQTHAHSCISILYRISTLRFKAYLSCTLLRVCSNRSSLFFLLNSSSYKKYSLEIGTVYNKQYGHSHLASFEEAQILPMFHLHFSLWRLPRMSNYSEEN